MNLLAIPYIFYSIYYQWRIAKQWCLLCLAVQAIIALQFVINLFGGYIAFWSISPSTIPQLFSVIASFGFSTTAILIILPALQQAKIGTRKSMELKQLKNNPSIFEALLFKERCVPMPLPEIGIVIGNPIGKFKLVKVCNPYCGPCASVHPMIDSLINNTEDLCVQIILPATENNNDIRKKPISHLLAIDALNDKVEILKALDDWYTAPIKDYSVFSEKYPVGEELNKQKDKIKLMLDWCQNVEIKHTPTFFLCLNTRVSNPKLYELPQIYDLGDLNYYLEND
jgi:thiol-disulfide isomerase/thioredoxin